MNLLNSIIALALITICPSIVLGQIYTPVQEQQLAETQKKYGLNPSAPLTGRIQPASEGILQKFREAGMSPTQHQLSVADSLKVVRAFLALPRLHQQVLKNRLLGISFLDNMPNTALAATVNPDDSTSLFTITFRAGILKQNVSEWLTEKEMGYFTPDNPNLRISIEAGKMDAIFYVLLHEASHILDGSGKLRAGFSSGVWLDMTTRTAKYNDPLLNPVFLHSRDKRLPISKAKQIYQAAARTPFVSLYSLSSTHEDFAEYLTVSHFSEKLKQPFKIIIYEKDKPVFTYEPMKSMLINSRNGVMRLIY